MLMRKGLGMQKYEFYLEGEHGVDFGIIRATDEKDLIRILKEHQTVRKTQSIKL